MSEPLPSCPPLLVTAGDSWSWTRTFCDYSSTDYTLSYTWAGLGALTSLPGWITVLGTGFSVTCPATATATLPPGLYHVFEILTGAGGFRLTNELQQMRVEPDPAQLVPGDLRTWAEKELDNIEAAITAFNTNGAITMYQIGRRMYQRSALDLLMQTRTTLWDEVQAQRQAARGGLGRRVQARFVDASSC